MNQRQRKKQLTQAMKQMGIDADVAKEFASAKRDIGKLEIKALEKNGTKKNEYNLSFSSEDPYCRYFYNKQKGEFEYLPEVLSHEDGAVDYQRLQDLGTVLFNHNSDVPIAKITNVGIEDKRGVATIEFGDDEESQKYKSKVDSGVLKGVSVGYVVNKYERKKNYCEVNGKKSDAMVATKWKIHEISIVSVPADATVGVGRELELEDIETPNYEIYEKQIELNRRKIQRKS